MNMRLTAVFCLLMLWSATVGAQENKQSSKNWLVNCATRADNTLSCAMRQTLTITKTGQTILIAQVVKPSANELPNLMFRLPHNLLLQKGLTFSIDNEKKQILPIVRADSKGSYATLKLSGSLMSRLRTGKQINLIIYSVSGGKAINIGLPLEGFAENSKHLK